MTKYFPFVLFILFFLYGFSFIFIVAYIRRKEGLSLDIIGFLKVFLGDLKNYYRLNQMFVKSAIKSNLNKYITYLISYINLASPVAIVVIVVVWAVLTI